MTASNETGNLFSRRGFLMRSAKAGVSIAAACSAGYLFYDSGGAIAPREPEAVRLPDFALPGMKGRMSVVRGSDRVKSLRAALNGLGGLAAFIKKGDRVLLKVNAAFASPPALSATTHPQLIVETVRLCYAAGAASVVLTDNPINDPMSCFRLTGIEQAAREAGAELILPREHYFRSTSVPGGMLIQNWPLLYEPFKGITKLIGMAPVKDHHRSGASLGMKNWYGLLGGRRNMFHQNIHTIIQELALMVRPTLVILDGTFSMMTNGPTGGSLSDLKRTDTLIVSTDQVAADAFAARLLNKTTDDLPFIAKAAAAGAGTADYEDLRPVIIQAEG
ncbi:MAG: DUF362 domain-containing protein [Thermodesulfobacteriota bacterium]